jgi:methionyl-tRNA synthetase
VSKTFYITTTLPYVNAEPHIGFAMEIVRADVVARFKKSQGFSVFFNTGTDEHGMKIWQKAKEEGKDPQSYVDVWADKFKDLKRILNLSEDLNFIRTTDKPHEESAREFWKICDKNGFIYKKNYKIKYCVGCELEKTESELEDGKCPIHPKLKIEEIEEENYFFKFSHFQKPLLDFYSKNTNFIVPDFRFNELKAFVERGLQDFSISRLKSKMPWGISVPGDENHVMYVWFDALVNYISAIGWPNDMEQFKKWAVDSGGMVQYCGKDNLRQQGAMWQAMLMAVGLPNSQTVVVDGFITGEGGIKMSKSLGNVFSPIEIVDEYGTDALRYFLLRELNSFEDSIFTKEKFKEAYNANLVNGLGNLVSRVMKMAETYLEAPVDVSSVREPMSVLNWVEKFDLKGAMDAIWSDSEIGMSVLDEIIQKDKPFEVAKNDLPKARLQITYLVKEIYRIAVLLEPFLPETSKKIKEAVLQNKKPENLFPRK